MVSASLDQTVRVWDISGEGVMERLDLNRGELWPVGGGYDGMGEGMERWRRGKRQHPRLHL